MNYCSLCNILILVYCVALHVTEVNTVLHAAGTEDMMLTGGRFWFRYIVLVQTLMTAGID